MSDFEEHMLEEFAKGASIKQIASDWRGAIKCYAGAKKLTKAEAENYVRVLLYRFERTNNLLRASTAGMELAVGSLNQKGNKHV